MSGLALPDGTRLLHIGPHKTGTTTIQNALWKHAEALRAEGIHYPGRTAHEMGAAMAVTLGRVDPGKSFDYHHDHWHEMVTGFDRDDPRVGVLSSEFYSEADDEHIAWLLDRLGPRTHVVITLRPLVRIIGSQWQQYVQNKLAASYDDWLASTLGDPDGEQRTPTFWRRHRHDRLVRRWVDAAGPDRVTVVVVDDRDPASLTRAFETLLGLAPGVLERSEERLNRSLTFDEVEFVRRFNSLRRHEPWNDADYDRFVRFGAARDLQARPNHPDDQRLLTPEWAVQRALSMGADFAETITASGARVIGSLGVLSDPELAPATGTNDPVDGVAPAAVAAFVGGVLNRMALVPGSLEPRAGAGVAEREVWARHRAVNHRLLDGWEAALEAELVELEGRRRRYVAAADATRRDVLRELARRARRRLPEAARRRRGQ